MDDATKKGLLIFAVTFSIRVVAAVVTTLTDLNPDSQADAVRFGQTAAAIARGIGQGQPYLYTPRSVSLKQVLVSLSTIDTYSLWGTFLAPFWLLPGPSGFYARVGSAFLGALAIYNVYLITRYYHSHQAGVLTTLPMMFYPSIIAIHSTLLREAFVLFGITTAARLLTITPERKSRLLSYGIAGLVLHITVLLRDDNFIIYVAAIAAAFVVHGIEKGYLSKRTIGIGAILSPVVFVFSLPDIREGIAFLSYIREVRGGGRADYLTEVVPRTVPELIAFSWIGAAYFLYAPFPWMIQTVPDLLVSIEGLVNIAFTIAAVSGIRRLWQRNASITTGLMTGLALGVVLYGVGTVNYGTGMRHRQMFLWVICLFGGIGITEYVKFRWPLQWNSNGHPDHDGDTASSNSN